MTNTDLERGNPASASREVPMLVKFSTLAGGVFIEVLDGTDRVGRERCFRFDAKGNAEWASYADLVSSNPSPRWFGHVFRQSDFTFA